MPRGRPRKNPEDLKINQKKKKWFIEDNDDIKNIEIESDEEQYDDDNVNLDIDTIKDLLCKNKNKNKNKTKNDNGGSMLGIMKRVCTGSWMTFLAGCSVTYILMSSPTAVQNITTVAKTIISETDVLKKNSDTQTDEKKAHMEEFTTKMEEVRDKLKDFVTKQQNESRG
jgi:hypothetical protein